MFRGPGDRKIGMILLFTPLSKQQARKRGRDHDFNTTAISMLMQLFSETIRDIQHSPLVFFVIAKRQIETSRCSSFTVQRAPGNMQNPDHSPSCLLQYQKNKRVSPSGFITRTLQAKRLGSSEELSRRHDEENSV